MPRVWTKHKTSNKKKQRRKKKENNCLGKNKKKKKPQLIIALNICNTNTSDAASNVCKLSKKPMTIWLLNNRFCSFWLEIPFNIYHENIVLFNAIYFIWNLTIYTIILVTIMFIVIELIEYLAYFI